MPEPLEKSSIQTAIAWCIAWGTKTQPQHPDKIAIWRKALKNGQIPTDDTWQQIQAQTDAMLQQLNVETSPTLADITKLKAQYSALGDRNIGVIYGGVTKVKSYVFESVDLQEIRGASALLDRVNLIDLPVLFHAEDYHASEGESNPYNLCQTTVTAEYCQKVRAETFSPLEQSVNASENEKDDSLISQALIPELIVYSTGGNILAFCPAAFVNNLCDAIERRYTTETLTASSSAVSTTICPLEIYCGLLKETVENTLWENKLLKEQSSNPVLQAYFGLESGSVEKAFSNRKNFGEIVGKLTNQFIQRRSGSENSKRPTRRYPAMFETHPFLVRDDSDIRSSVKKVTRLPDKPNLSDATAIKRRIGQITKRDETGENWYQESGFEKRHPLWLKGRKKDEHSFVSWVSKFEEFLKKTQRIREYDKDGQMFSGHDNFIPERRYKREARSLHEIGDASNGYVGYIYADGNSMGRYIREKVKTPEGFQQFSEDILEATQDSVYEAITQHLSPHKYYPNAKSSRQPDKNKKDSAVWIHPFEIITIGGDDVLLVVPANKALEIAATIGETFEELLLATKRYDIDPNKAPADPKQQHRYNPSEAKPSRCQLSTSIGVLITAVDTPIYYAERLFSQLLKSAKKRLKQLNKNHYHGGTVDFLVLKSVTMITSNIDSFRQEGLTDLAPKADPERSPDLPPLRQHNLKFYGAPYTLHELRGLIDTVKAIKQSQFSKSQLYQIRGLLARGKRTAILNYRYFRVRLDAISRSLLENRFEQAWCNAETNSGNLAPWRTTLKINGEKKDKTTYETIWRELVELEPFIDIEEDNAAEDTTLTDEVEQVSGGLS